MNIVFKSLLALVAVTGIVAYAAPASHATTATTASTCVDGSVQSNLVVTWKTNGSVTVATKGNKPVCNDVTLFFSSYTMPDNYNGQPFMHNPTASPQTIFDNATAVMKKGEEAKTVAMNINLPESCKNIQVDVYYAPKIETVGTNGHGEQYISGKIINKTQGECAPVTPEVPTPEAQTPETPAPEVIIPATEMPAEMPKTGSELAGTAVIGTVLSAATYAGLLIRNKRR